MAEQTLETYVTSVVQEARTLIDFLSSNGYYLPSFETGGFKEYPDQLPSEILESQRRLAESAQAVADLANGPKQYLRSLSRGSLPPLLLHYLLHFNIPQHVPLHGSISYTSLAQLCGLDPDDDDEGEGSHQLRRILHSAMTHRLFKEISPEEVSHTPFSAALVGDPGLREEVLGNLEGLLPGFKGAAAARMVGGLGNGNLEMGRKRGQRGGLGFEVRHVVEGFGWGDVGRVVEIGGGGAGDGEGSVGVALARAYPDLKVVVEDFPDVVEKAGEKLPKDVEGRVVTVGHDYRFSQPDQVAGAQVYLLRGVLRNYSDKEAGQILKNLVGFLADGARLLVVEAVVRAPGASAPWFEREIRDSDIELMATLGTKERRWEEWECLFKSVDANLRVLSISQPSESALSLIEIGYRK